MKRIAIIAAHPDDEAIGCGGTILKHKSMGDEVSFLWMTDGIGARGLVQENDLAIRQSALNRALKFINPDYFLCENFPDNELEQVPLLELTRAVEVFLKKTKPDIIYTHFYNDLNIDHALTHRAVLTAVRPGSTTFVKEIYSFEVASSTEWSVGREHFIPDMYVNIGNQIALKKEYLKCYESEMRAHPHPRSIENIIAINQVRGAQVNLEFAEAFITTRRILDE